MNHPSIIDIRNQVANDMHFSFTSVTEKEMMKEIEVLNTKKSGTFMNIPTKKLKDAKEEIVKPLTQIWNNEILIKMKFPSKLKLVQRGDRLAPESTAMSSQNLKGDTISSNYKISCFNGSGSFRRCEKWYNLLKSDHPNLYNCLLKHRQKTVKVIKN